MIALDEELRFPPRIVCKALGLSAGTLASWASRGYLARFDASDTIAGRGRQFTLLDALSLAMIKHLSSHRIDIPDFPGFAVFMADQYLMPVGSPTSATLALYDAPLGRKLFFPGDEREERKPTVEITFDLAAIFGAAQQALAEAVAASIRPSAK